MIGAPFLAVLKAKWRDDAAEISPAFFIIFFQKNKKKEKKTEKKWYWEKSSMEKKRGDRDIFLIIFVMFPLSITTGEFWFQ